MPLLIDRKRKPDVSRVVFIGFLRYIILFGALHYSASFLANGCFPDSGRQSTTQQRIDASTHRYIVSHFHCPHCPAICHGASQTRTPSSPQSALIKHGRRLAVSPPISIRSSGRCRALQGEIGKWRVCGRGCQRRRTSDRRGVLFLAFPFPFSRRPRL